MPSYNTAKIMLDHCYGNPLYAYTLIYRLQPWAAIDRDQV